VTDKFIFLFKTIEKSRSVCSQAAAGTAMFR